MRINIDINLTMPLTFKTSIIIAVMTRHIIPSVTMLGSKSVNTVFVFPVIRLLWGPEPKTTYFFVCPHKGALHTSVIESNPRSLSVVTVLNVDIFFLIVNRYQIGTHRRTVWLSGQPRGACTTCEVTVATKITPSWLANICDKDIKRLKSPHIWSLKECLFYRLSQGLVGRTEQSRSARNGGQQHERLRTRQLHKRHSNCLCAADTLRRRKLGKQNWRRQIERILYMG